MATEKIYDAAVIGGGLSGLCFSILVARAGFSVVLFEKERYPFTKVCGEYISNESYDFLNSEIGLPLEALGVSHISKLLISAPDGSSLTTDLESGGFGISRYRLDNELKKMAEAAGVHVNEGCKIDEVEFSEELFMIRGGGQQWRAKSAVAAWGKRSNLDVKWHRRFVQRPLSRRNNYIGIKYHVKGELASDLISLHNFKNGYCGISKVEDDRFCLCYFTLASNLKKGAHAVDTAEEEILSKNPRLRAILHSVSKVDRQPTTISQVSLQSKTTVENHVLMLGDASGMISPLCGNGMSIAMHSAKIAALQAIDFLTGNISRERMEINYGAARKKTFMSRIGTGRLIQYLFGKKLLTNVAVRLMKHNQFFLKKVIGFTHGKPF